MTLVGSPQPTAVPAIRYACSIYPLGASCGGQRWEQTFWHLGSTGTHWLSLRERTWVGNKARRETSRGVLRMSELVPLSDLTKVSRSVLMAGGLRLWGQAALFTFSLQGMG